QLPNARGRRSSIPLNFTCRLSTASSGISRSSGNKLNSRLFCSSSSNTPRVFTHAASCVVLISPRYNTVRWTILPDDNRRFSTTLKYRWSLPSFLRFVSRKNIAPRIAKIFSDEKRVGLHYSRFQKTHADLSALIGKSHRKSPEIAMNCESQANVLERDNPVSFNNGLPANLAGLCSGSRSRVSLIALLVNLCLS